MSTGATVKNSRPNEPASAEIPTKRRLPPLRSLLAFEAAARHANFTRAAAELAVTPSAISHQIQTLEDFLGTKLFLRQSGQVVLTSTGSLYQSEIETALTALADATQRIAPQSQTNTLLILSSPSFAAKWLQPRLPRFMSEHADIRLRVGTIADPASISAMRFDVAVCYGAPSLADMNVTPLMIERIRPLCSPGLAAALALQTLCDLNRATLIHSANSVTWDAFFRHLGAANIRPYNELWLDRSTMAIEAAVAGQGVVLESDVLTQSECGKGQLVAPFDGERASVFADAYYLVTPRGYRSRHYCAAFVDWLLASIPPDRRPRGANG
jgi:LysR family transcriptional regulator, glycine cleavage system transcriptional activator